MTADQNGPNQPVEDPRSRASRGADAAMLRAAIKARKRALATAGSYAIFENGETIYMTDLGDLAEEADALVSEETPAD